MNRRTTYVAASALALAALSGCSTGEEASVASGTPGAQPTSVPSGVAQQYATLQEEIAAHGAEQTSGDWNIGYIVEPAEPWYEMRDGKQVFRPVAPGETHHLEIVPREASTGRVVPNTPVRLEVLDAEGKVVQAKDLQPIHGEFLHYSHNFAVPTAGTYRLRATVGAPTFLRHGHEGEAPALAEGTTVTFDNVSLEPSQ